MKKTYKIEADCASLMEDAYNVIFSHLCSNRDTANIVK